MSDLSFLRMHLSMLLMMEAFDRLCPGTFKGRRSPKVQAVAREAWAQAGYCIDAPGELPAGGCQGIQLLPGDPGQVAIQITTERDPAA